MKLTLQPCHDARQHWLKLSRRGQSHLGLRLPQQASGSLHEMGWLPTVIPELAQLFVLVAYVRGRREGRGKQKGQAHKD